MKKFLAAASAALLGVALFQPFAHAALISPTWSYTTPAGRNLSGTAGQPFSSPAVGDLLGDGAETVVAGYSDGYVRAFNAATGSLLWSRNTGGAVHASPTLVDLSGDRKLEIVVSSESGWVYAFNANGTDFGGRWPQHTMFAGPSTGFPEGWFSSVAAGDLFGNGGVVLVAGSWDHYLYAWHTDGTLLPGFPIDTWDTIWDTPALADLDGNGQLEIVVGSDTEGHQYGVMYYPGAKGIFWAFRPDLRQAPGWPKVLEQVPWSSPAVADLGNDGVKDIVAGSGHYFPLPAGRQLNAWRQDGSSRPGWPVVTSHQNFGSPAIGDVNGDGKDEVVSVSNDGTMYVLDADGRNLPGWPKALGYGVLSSPSIGPVDGSGRNGIWVAVGSLLRSYNGSGTMLTETSMSGVAVAAPTIAQVEANKVNVFVTAMLGSDRWTTYSYPVAGATSIPARAWPTFHGNMRRSGTNLASPRAPSHGYWMTGSDGGIFSFGSAGYYGSTGGIALARPVVGMTSTKSGQGYWNVASDGGIFAFGDAGFYGSMGGRTLAKPVVGMTRTGSSGGYWMVASDGGIFAFGDSGFYGSMGGRPLARPVVGMSKTRSGGGYWMVASDGGIFAFGDAGFYGSMGGRPLAQPIVGMAATPSGNGYWLVASDGGIFAFGDAGYFGSTGGLRIPAPIVSMAATPSGNGYWLAGSDGRVYSFGDAAYFGSMAGTTLFRPVVGMAFAG